MEQNTRLLGKAKRRVTFSDVAEDEPVAAASEQQTFTQPVSYGSINGAVPIYSNDLDPESLPRVEIRQLRQGHLTTLSSDYESLNYDAVDSQVYKEAVARKNGFFLYRVNFTRWVVMFFIGVCIALVGCSIDICIAELSRLKYKFLQKSMDQFFKEGHFVIPYAQWVGISIAFATVAAMIVTFAEPVAAGSGIPLVKAYLNGINIKRLIRIKTLFVKSIGVTCSVLGGLAVGKEGPMVHSGAVVAAGLSQGKSTTFRLDLGLLKQFRTDQEKRDFVSAGAAAGVAAAFGAPVGGVLFSLEEGASFWNQNLTWRIFFCSMISAFTLNAVLSTYHGRPGELAYTGLLNFGKFPDMPFAFWELPIFVGMGILGGLTGALFNQLNYYLSIFRKKYVSSSWAKVLEVILVCWCTISLGFAMIYYIDDCKTKAQDDVDYPIQVFCKEGEYNAVAAMWFQTPEASVRALFHDTPGTHRPLSVGLFFLCYFLLSCWTYGLCISSGVFIPSLLSGAAWGRLIGLGVFKLSQEAAWADPGKYALIGAAAQLGGIVRMTLSLTVILIETTGNISLGLGLMITLMTAKCVGDFFNLGIYDMHIQLAGLPMLPWAPPPLSTNVQVRDIMSSPVVTLKPIERVARIMDVLQGCTHHGFPITDGVFVASTCSKTYGNFQGLVLRYQVLMVLREKLFCGPNGSLRPPLPLESFKSAYPRYVSLQDVDITEDERKLYIDLRPYINSAPYTIRPNATLPRAFNLFRALGLRHLVVTDDNNEVVGILTRKDIAKFRSLIRCRRVEFVQLPVT